MFARGVVSQNKGRDIRGVETMGDWRVRTSLGSRTTAGGVFYILHGSEL